MFVWSVCATRRRLNIFYDRYSVSSELCHSIASYHSHAGEHSCPKRFDSQKPTNVNKKKEKMSFLCCHTLARMDTITMGLAGVCSNQIPFLVFFSNTLAFECDTCARMTIWTLDGAIEEGNTAKKK